MSDRFRAGDEPAATREDYWRHVASTALGPIGITGEVDGADEVLLGEVGLVRVGMLTAHRPGGARLAARHLREADPGYCKIDILAAGEGVVAQDGRDAALRPGDFTYVDLSRPARWTMSAMRMVAVCFPRALLPLRDDDLARLTATTIPGDRGAGGLISSMALHLPGHLDDPDVAGGTRLGSAVLDLLTAGMAARLDRPGVVPAETRRRALLLRVQASIEERIGEPGLSPADLAAEHHISQRYLHKLFESEETTVAGWIRWRRLERCRRDLLDPTQSTRPVSAIGARWGLANAAHFSRVFRATYGIAPAEYRRAHLAS